MSRPCRVNLNFKKICVYLAHVCVTHKCPFFICTLFLPPFHVIHTDVKAGLRLQKKEKGSLNRHVLQSIKKNYKISLLKEEFIVLNMKQGK